MIERPRKRPRTKSVSFRTFGWLVTAEAVAAIVRNVAPTFDDSHVRAWLSRSQMNHIRRFGEALIRQDRGRRYWP